MNRWLAGAVVALAIVVGGLRAPGFGLRPAFADAGSGSGSGSSTDLGSGSGSEPGASSGSASDVAPIDAQPRMTITPAPFAFPPTLPLRAPIAPKPKAAPAPAPAIAAAAAPAAPESAKASSVLAAKVIVGIIILMVAAYIGGHRRVVRFQERLGITGVITAGFPFVFMGVIASLPSVGILTGHVLDQMRPVLHFGLGWLGFIIGAQLDIRVLDRVPKGTAYLILVEALGPFAFTAAAAGFVMLAFGQSVHSSALWRDIILLGAAAAMTAPRKFRGFAARAWQPGRGADVLLGQLDELVGVIGLLFITAYFRDPPTGQAWALPDTAWVFVSLGVGVAIGLLIFAMVRVPTTNAEFLAIVLGGIAFASGLAGYLRLSPIVICFLAGVLVTNFPNEQRASVFKILTHLERPVHMMFLIVAGAVWQIGDWRGWALVPLFVAARAAGKWAGVFASRRTLGADLPAGFADHRELVMPLSSLSIALVVSVASLYHDEGVPWILTAVIGGSIATEFLVQITGGGRPNPADDELDPAEQAALDAIDEIDGPDDDDDGLDPGPTYRELAGMDPDPAPKPPAPDDGAKKP